MIRNPEVGDVVRVNTLNHQGVLQECRATVTKGRDPSDSKLMIGVRMEIGGELVPEHATYCPPGTREHPTWRWPAD